MAKERIVIELEEKDLIELVAKEYNLNLNKTTLFINHYRGNQREPESLTLKFESERDKDLVHPRT